MVVVAKVLLGSQELCDVVPLFQYSRGGSDILPTSAVRSGMHVYVHANTDVVDGIAWKK